MIFYPTQAEYARLASNPKQVHETSSKTSRNRFCFAGGAVVYQRLHDDE
jgi:hypothetical protein